MSRGFVLTDYGPIKMYEIKSFRKTGLVSHGFSTRLGGRGTSPYDTLNLAFHVGDRPEVVLQNRQLVCRALGAEISQMVAGQQVHGADLAVVSAGQAGRGALASETALPAVDGLLTNQPGLLLSAFYADCVPVFLLDPVRRAIALVHAGWKGTVARIGAGAVAKMSAVFGTDPADCLAGIGPSIGPCCYEVDEPVIRLGTGMFTWWAEVLKPAGPGRAMLDLWAANQKILLEAGIREENLSVARVCTSCHRRVLFSHRGGRGVTGRMGAFLMLKACLQPK